MEGEDHWLPVHFQEAAPTLEKVLNTQGATVTQPSEVKLRPSLAAPLLAPLPDRSSHGGRDRGYAGVQQRGRPLPKANLAAVWFTSTCQQQGPTQSPLFALIS